MSTDKKEYGISVIIPCYNVGQYVEETLKSVLNQSFKNYEIICLNDGSTDGTLEILNKYNIEFKILIDGSKLKADKALTATDLKTMEFALITLS